MVVRKTVINGSFKSDKCSIYSKYIKDEWQQDHTLSRRLSWSYGSWIYNYLCNQCLSSLMLWVQTLLLRCVLDTTLCEKVYQWLAAGLDFLRFPPPIKLTCHNITEILLKVAINTIHHLQLIRYSRREAFIFIW